MKSFCWSGEKLCYEKALFEMKSDEKALSDEELTKKWQKKTPKPKRGAPMQFEIFRNLRSRKRKKNLLSELQLFLRLK